MANARTCPDFTRSLLGAAEWQRPVRLDSVAAQFLASLERGPEVIDEPVARAPIVHRRRRNALILQRDVSQLRDHRVEEVPGPVGTQRPQPLPDGVNQGVAVFCNSQ